MAKEARDAVNDRPFAGVHVLATALLSARNATEDELKLAERILLRDPATDTPAEHESIASVFNRQMDAAIDSANASSRLPTRVGRRAQMARDLDREGLVLMDRAKVAELIASIMALREERGHLLDQLESLEGEELGAELGHDDPPLIPSPPVLLLRESDGGSDPLRGLEQADG